jgi:hypothetical protein
VKTWRQTKVRNKFSGLLPENISKSFLPEFKELLRSLGDDGKSEYLRSECFSKYTDLTTTRADVRRCAAIKKWLATDERNRVTNFRLSHAEAEERDFGWTDFITLRDRIRLIIRQVLGPLDEVVLLTGNHTNGASTRVKRSPTAAFEKFTGIAHLTASAFEHWSNSMGDSLLGDQNLELTFSSQMFTVPKSTDIDRVACKEPEINMFLQRSVGNHIRMRLRRRGIDLNDQSINRELARTAHLRGLATIDLSSASDSISKQLVFSLLPFEWWSILSDLRVDSTVIEDYPVKGDSFVHRLEMFSSMGNGFTFELESLLFYAITRAVCWLSRVKGTISVYGDDIIAPVAIVPRLKRVFDFFGFMLNMKKTHFKGYFRESCGGHYYRGLDITPFYIRSPVVRYTDLIRVLNQLLEWDGRGWGFITTPEVLAFHRKWASVVPSVLHGGNDIESITSLVTGHAPRSRICLKKRKAPYDDYAAYLYWHNTRGLSELPISCDPYVETTEVIRRFPAYAERTTWTPYIIMM